MQKPNNNWKIITWITAILFILIGFSLSAEDVFASTSFFIFGIFLIPPVYDIFKFKFANTKKSRRISKLIIAALGFTTSIFAGIIGNTYYSNIESEIITTYENLSESDSLAFLIPKLKDRISILPDNHTNRLSKIVDDIALYDSYFSKTNSLLSTDIIIDKLSVDNLDSLYKKSYLVPANSLVISQQITEKVNDIIPTKSDFPTEVDYLYFRMKHSKRSGNFDKYEKYFMQILKTKKDFDFDTADLTYAVDNLYSEKKFEKRVYKLLDYHSSYNFESTLSFTKKLLAMERYRAASRFANKAIKIDDDNSRAIKLAGDIAYARGYKKTTVKFYERLNELGKLDLASCKKLRELTKYIARWHYYSICCDGSRSESTGRGTCSHHRGVCKSMKEPVYRYKYSYCG